MVRASSLFLYCLIGSAAGALDSGEIVGIAAGAPVPAATTLPPLRVVNAKAEGSSNNVLKILGVVAALGVFGAVGAGIAKKVKDSQGVEEQEEDPEAAEE